MRSRVPPQYTQRDRKIMAEYINKQIEDGICKAQYLMLLSFHDVHGIGESRLAPVLERYAALLDEYNGYLRDDVADEKLTEAMKKLMPHYFTKLYQ